MSAADVVARETEWLNTEPLVDYPALTTNGTNIGPFDFIGAHVRRLSQHPHQVHVYRERTLELRESTGWKKLTHDMLLGVLWTQQLNPEQGHVELQQLSDAVDALVARVRGQLDDHTHGDRFWTAGETGGVAAQGTGIDVRMPDWRSVLVQADSPLAMGRAYVVEVRYPIVEFLEG